MIFQTYKKIKTGDNKQSYSEDHYNVEGPLNISMNQEKSKWTEILYNVYKICRKLQFSEKHVCYFYGYNLSFLTSRTWLSDTTGLDNVPKLIEELEVLFACSNR